jgi:hypothetical protein
MLPKDDDKHVFLVEKWRDQEALDAHAKGPMPGNTYKDRQPMAYDALRTIMPIAGWPEERAREVEISVGADQVLPTRFRIGAAGAAPRGPSDSRAGQQNSLSFPSSLKTASPPARSPCHAAQRSDPALLLKQRLKQRRSCHLPGGAGSNSRTWRSVIHSNRPARRARLCGRRSLSR